MRPMSPPTAHAGPDNEAALQPIRHPSVWDARSLRADRRWLVVLTPGDIEELADSTARIERNGKPLETLTRVDFPLGALGERLRALRSEVLHGRGFVQLRGLPVANLGHRTSAIAFYGMGLHMGDRFASQNKHGHLLGHVRDLGESRGNASQRGPYSRETIPFHVDACDIVGLCCLRTAKSGGESCVASSGLVFNTLLAERPDLVRALMRPVFRDRRDEVPPGKPPWYAIPVFNLYAGLLSTSIEPTYIGSVARHFGGTNPHTPAQLEAIEEVQRLARELRFDIEFERGDIQYVNNHALMHSRLAFTDEPAARDGSGGGRHLLRLWMLNDDGRPLPDAYHDRHGTRATVKRPGGIVGPDTVPNAPLP